MVTDHRKLAEFYRGKKVLVTGHTGFKGSWLTIWLEKMGSVVTGYSLDPLTEKDNFVLSGLSGLIRDVRGNVNDLKQLTRLVEEINPDIVFHLAAQAIVIDSYLDPVNTLGTNVMGTVNLLEACRMKESHRAIIIITSDKCYENREWVYPYRETDPMGGFDPYSASKGAAEIVCASYRNSFLNKEKGSAQVVASARAGNVIGGGDWSKYRIIPDCVRAIEKDETIILRNPHAIRPWQHVLEPLSGYLQLGMVCYEDPRFGEAWNFGPGTAGTFTVSEVVDHFLKHFGKGRWETVPNPQFHEARFLALDISKAVNELGWKPRLGFNETVNLTADWYRQYRGVSSVLELCREQICYFSDNDNQRK